MSAKKELASIFFEERQTHMLIEPIIQAFKKGVSIDQAMEEIRANVHLNELIETTSEQLAPLFY